MIFNIQLNKEEFKDFRIFFIQIADFNKTKLLILIMIKFINSQKKSKIKLVQIIRIIVNNKMIINIMKNTQLLKIVSKSKILKVLSLNQKVEAEVILIQTKKVINKNCY